MDVNGYLVPKNIHQRLHILPVAYHQIPILTAAKEEPVDDGDDLLEHAVLPLVHQVVLVLEAEVAHVGNRLEVLERADVPLDAVLDGVNDNGVALVPVVVALGEY